MNNSYTGISQTVISHAIQGIAFQPMREIMGNILPTHGKTKNLNDNMLSPSVVATRSQRRSVKQLYLTSAAGYLKVAVIIIKDRSIQRLELHQLSNQEGYDLWLIYSPKIAAESNYEVIVTRHGSTRQEANLPVSNEDRDTNTYRPLAIGDPFYRILGKLVAKLVQKECEKKLSPIQLGCGVSGGSDKLGRIAQLALGESPETCVVSLDIANAFGNISRKDVFSNLDGPFKWLRSLFIWAYGKPVTLFNSKGVEVFKATEGLMQGDSLSSMFFCLAFQPVLQKIQDALNHMHTLPADRGINGYYGQLMAFIDDVNLIVHCNKVDLAIQAAENALREHGLPLNTQKTIIIKGSHPTVNYSGAKPTCSTAKIVGIPVGHSADGRKAILDKTKGRVQRELDALRKANVI
eukprot:gene1863-1995_t